MPPLVVPTVPLLRAFTASCHAAGQRVGLVPTMGALHAGHLALIRAAKSECDRVVVTIFVNPTQFNQAADLERYPRTLEADLQLCDAAGADAVFHPAVEAVYPPDFRTFVEVTHLTDTLCGPARPGHFRGVATVVLKLFHMAGADVAYFGQKDAQQVRVIQQMVEDLNVPIAVRVVPTVREPDGLAMSSRNRFLDPTQRQQAAALYRAMQRVERAYQGGERSVERLESVLRAGLAEAPLGRVDYAQVVDGQSLQPVARVERAALVAVAVFFGPTRLIDNLPLHPQ